MRSAGGAVRKQACRGAGDAVFGKMLVAPQEDAHSNALAKINPLLIDRGVFLGQRPKVTKKL